MGMIRGERTIEIDAPIQRCFDIAADIEGAPAWQGSLKEVEVLERDADGRPAVVKTTNDAKVKSVHTRLRFSYDNPRAIRWAQEKGDVKSLDGWWALEELGPDRTRATYGLEVDPGRVLGLLVRGPWRARCATSCSATPRRASSGPLRRADRSFRRALASLRGGWLRSTLRRASRHRHRPHRRDPRASSSSRR
jgi:hypothetical protein